MPADILPSENRFHFSENFSDFISVSTRLPSDKFGLFAKVIYGIGVDFFRLIGIVSEDNQVASELKRSFSIVKLAESPLAILKSMNALRLEVVKAVAASKDPNNATSSLTLVARCMRVANNCIAPIWELCDLLTRIVFHIHNETVKTIKGIASLSLVITMGWNLGEKLGELARSTLPLVKGKEYNREFAKVGVALLTVTSQVSYIAMGALSALIIFGGYSFASSTFVILSTITISQGVFDYYYTNLGAPKKHN